MTWDVVDEFTRTSLLNLTAVIPNEDLSGYAFGFALVLSEHLTAPLRAVFQ